jgi:hypothetical protein
MILVTYKNVSLLKHQDLITSITVMAHGFHFQFKDWRGKSFSNHEQPEKENNLASTAAK